MKPRKLVGIDSNQSGFTLIEMIIVIAITGIIAGGIAAAVFQIFDVNGRSVVHMTAVKEVEDAAHWIIRDAQMAQNVNLTAPGGFPLTLTWVEWDNTRNDVTYSLQNGELQRSHSINGEPPTVTAVIRHINSDPQMTNVRFSTGVLTFKITATISGFRSASESRSFEVIPRASP